MKSAESQTTIAVPSSEEIELEKIEIKSKKEPLGKVRAKYNYFGQSEKELSFRKNDEFLILSKSNENGWTLGLFDHTEGYFPTSYIEILEEFEIKETKPSPNYLLNDDAPETPSPRRRAATSSKSYDKAAIKNSSNNNSPKQQQNKKAEKKNVVTLLENFQMGERIGKGQYGSVYRGINVDNGEMVAIKQVGKIKMKKAEIASIMGELELLKQLDHTNVLSYKGFIETKEHINIVLDFVEGGSLASILGKFGVIPEKLAICYIKQILDGLDYLHDRDVIHRDIKCGNILVTKDGSVKLADFGIAMKLGDPSAPAVGSPYWMAPEVIEMKGSSSACDIWALGCTIIELLTGQPPYFEFNQVQAMFCMVENEKPPYPQNMSNDMKSFLDQCFKRDPKDRSTAKKLKKHALLGGNAHSSTSASDDNDFDLEALDDIDLNALSGGLEDYNLDLGDLSNINNLLDALGESHG